jgi:hypothetical protein
MGAWGHLAFDNDTANDWAYDLEGVADLSLVESAFGELAKVGDDRLDQGIACNALAACEILARCQGNAGYKNAYTEKVDEWVTKHNLKPSPALLKRAEVAIDRILGENSALRELWDESPKGAAWRKSVEELRQRLRASPQS